MTVLEDLCEPDLIYECMKKKCEIIKKEEGEKKVIDCCYPNYFNILLSLPLEVTNKIVKNFLCIEFEFSDIYHITLWKNKHNRHSILYTHNFSGNTCSKENEVEQLINNFLRNYARIYKMYTSK